MEAITKEMQKHFKITARKKLYFALSVMFQESRNTLMHHAKNAKTLSELAKEDDAPEEVKKAALMAIAPMAMSVRPIYCLVNALKEYKAAMGEYPEFTGFMVDDEQDLESAIGKTLTIIDTTQAVLDALATKGYPAPRLKEGAFGKDFIAACEKNKIKGE